MNNQYKKADMLMRMVLINLSLVYEYLCVLYAHPNRRLTANLVSLCRMIAVVRRVQMTWIDGNLCL